MMLIIASKANQHGISARSLVPVLWVDLSRGGTDNDHGPVASG